MSTREEHILAVIKNLRSVIIVRCNMILETQRLSKASLGASNKKRHAELQALAEEQRKGA